MKRLCGVNPPVITIFDEHHKVDIEASKRQADFLISKGVDGLAYLGTSGEFSIMTVEEKKNFINEMIKYVNGRVNVIVGVGDTCLENTMDLLKFVEQAGADGVLLINPYFSVYSTDMVEAYFGYVASHTSLPIIIYNFPDLTGYCFNADVVARIVKANPNVVGIKDTIADFNHVLSMQKVKEINPDFSVFSAYENQAMGLLVCGVDSSMQLQTLHRNIRLIRIRVQNAAILMKLQNGSTKWLRQWISMHIAHLCSWLANRLCTTECCIMMVRKDFLHFHLMQQRRQMFTIK